MRSANSAVAGRIVTAILSERRRKRTRVVEHQSVEDDRRRDGCAEAQLDQAGVEAPWRNRELEDVCPFHHRTRTEIATVEWRGQRQIERRRPAGRRGERDAIRVRPPGREDNRTLHCDQGDAGVARLYAARGFAQRHVGEDERLWLP